MPTTRKRIRPVIEEIVETPSASAEVPHDAHRKHVHVEEEKQEAPAPFVETVHEVASYDEPALVDNSLSREMAEVQARKLLNNEDKKSGGNLKLIFFITVITALIVGFIAGGVYVYITGVTNKGEEVQETPAPSASAAPSSTPVPTATPTPVAVNTFSVNVLNGSGVIGAASKVKASLESGGFKVTGTGNAKNYEFKNTVIQTKASVPASAVATLKDSLKDYVVEVGDALPATSTFDIVVTAGKN